MPTLQADINAVLSFSGIADLGGFQAVTGLEEVAEVVDDFPPGAQYADKSVAKASLGNATVTTSWVESRHRSLYDQMKGKTGAEGTLGRLVRDSARNIVNTETFTVKLVRNKGPEGDTNGGTAKATWELELAVTGRG